MLGFCSFSECPISALPNVQAAATVIQGGYSDKREGKRFFIKKGNKLLVFSRQQSAIDALDDAQNDEQIEFDTEVAKVERIKTEPFKKVEIPEVEVDLAELKAFAKRKGEIEQYQKWIKQQEYEALTRMFDDMREEEEVELLLLYA